MSQTPILRIEGLDTTFYTEDETVRAVKGLNLEILPGRTLGLVGESGSGKSVTSLSVLRLLPDRVAAIENGKIEFLDRDLLQVPDREMFEVRGAQISMIFQEPMTSLNPVLTVGSQVMEAILIHQKVAKDEARKRTVNLFREVGLPDPERRIDMYPHQISGGHAAARHDRDGALLQPEAAHRRRAHHGARRHHPGADPGAPPQAARHAEHGHPLHLARPRRHRRDRRRGGGDVPRRAGGARSHRPDVRGAEAPVHAGPPRLPPATGVAVHAPPLRGRLHGGEDPPGRPPGAHRSASGPEAVPETAPPAPRPPRASRS